MGKALIGCIALVVGFVIGWSGYAIKDAGDDFGMRLGICQTVTSAKSLGFLDDGQIDAVLKNAGVTFVGKDAKVGAGTAASDCSTFLAGLETVTVRVPRN